MDEAAYRYRTCPNERSPEPFDLGRCFGQLGAQPGSASITTINWIYRAPVLRADIQRHLCRSRGL